MNERQFQKLKDNIARSGRYPALIVRPLDAQKDKFEIVDGYYRHLALRDLGVTEAKCDVWPIDAKEARLLLATLNRIHGTDGTEKRARLLAQLRDDFDEAEMVALMPETERAINSLLKALDQGDFGLEVDQGLIEEGLIQSGVDTEQAERMADLFQPPTGKMKLSFVFEDTTSYNKAVKFFGKKGDAEKLVDLIDNYERKN